MGRPLYSRVFRTTPAVREPEPPSCEKWSYLNAFDPDSDEFFDSENAVYEDFVDPVAPVNPEDDDDDDDDEEEEEEEERDMLVVRIGNASPIPSESDTDSLLAVGAEDPTHLDLDETHDVRQVEEGELAPVARDPAVRVRLASSFAEVRWGSQMTGSARSHSRRGFATTAAARTISYLPFPQRGESLPVPTPSAPIPVPAVSRPTTDERPLSLPSTPPRQTMSHFSISPPPATTPRLYSWARNPSHSASPSSGGPFTNPHARTSYAHLSPALIRLRDVTV